MASIKKMPFTFWLYYNKKHCPQRQDLSHISQPSPQRAELVQITPVTSSFTLVVLSCENVSLFLFFFLLRLSFTSCFHFWEQHIEERAMAGAFALPLQEYFASLDETSLPKILQVCSGVYFQGKWSSYLYCFVKILNINIIEEDTGSHFFHLCSGSVYELSGSEVCFSTGDLIKVIGLELHSVSCQDVLNNENFELPITHTGWFETHFSKMFSLPPFPDFSVFQACSEWCQTRCLSVRSKKWWA